MSGRLSGRVALIAGDVGGVGRAQAVRLAEAGADLILLTHRGSHETRGVPGLSMAAMTETARRVEALGRQVIVFAVDLLDEEALDTALAKGVATLERLDVVYATAAGGTVDGLPDVDTADSGGTDHACGRQAPTTLELPPKMWQKMLDVSLTATWKTVKVAIPYLLPPHGEGGAIVLTAPHAHSGDGTGPLVAVEHGIVGLARTLAVELAPYRIRVNSVTASTANQEDSAAAGLVLASDEASSVTGVPIPASRIFSHSDAPVQPSPR